MNKWKVFTVGMAIWGLSLAFLGFPPLVGLFFGIIPALTHATIFTLIIKEKDSFSKMLLKSFIIFIILAGILSMESMLLLGMLFCFLSIILSVIGLPIYAYRSKKK